LRAVGLYGDHTGADTRSGADTRIVAGGRAISGADIRANVRVDTSG
jgi:hypothetical protein